MSTSIVHVLTVIGKAATEVEAACVELLGRRIESDSKNEGSFDWSAADHQALEDLCVALIRASRELPVLYCAQYLDCWTVADSRFCILDWPDERRRQIYGSAYGLAFYPSKFSLDLLTQIKKCRRRRFYRNQSEDRWFLDQMKEAIEAALWLESPFLTVSISECLCPSRHDEEIKASLKKSIVLPGRRK